MSAALPTACRDADEFLLDLACGESVDVPADARAHVDSCERCRGELDALGRTRRLMALPLEEPSDAMDARILAALDAEEPAVRQEAIAAAPMAMRARASAGAPPAAAPRTTPRRARRWVAPLSGIAGVALVASLALVLTKNANEPSIDATSTRAEAADKGLKPFDEPPPPVAPPPPKELAPEAQASHDEKRVAAEAGAQAMPPREEERAKVAAKKEQKPVATTRPALPPPAPAKAAAMRSADVAPRAPESAPAPATMAKDEVEREATVPGDFDRVGAPGARMNANAGAGLVARAPAQADEATTLLARADELRRGEAYAAALALYRRAAGRSDLTAAESERALSGEFEALLALGRLDEAQSVASSLAARFSGHADALLRVRARRAASRPADAAQAAPAAAAPPPR